MLVFHRKLTFRPESSGGWVKRMRKRERDCRVKQRISPQISIPLHCPLLHFIVLLLPQSSSPLRLPWPFWTLVGSSSYTCICFVGCSLKEWHMVLDTNSPNCVHVLQIHANSFGPLGSLDPLWHLHIHSSFLLLLLPTTLVGGGGGGRSAKRGGYLEPSLVNEHHLNDCVSWKLKSQRTRMDWEAHAGEHCDLGDTRIDEFVQLFEKF